METHKQLPIFKLTSGSHGIQAVSIPGSPWPEKLALRAILTSQQEEQGDNFQ